MRCGAGFDRCVDWEDEDTLEEQYDNYGIYAGRWHEECWFKFGYRNFVFDESYAGERLEEEDY